MTSTLTPGHSARAHQVHLRRSLVLGGLGCLLFCSPTVLEGQGVHGVVRSLAGEPIPGAVITSLDSVGRTLARTMADGSGKYAVVITPGARTIRVAKIGFSPVTRPVSATIAGRLDFRMERSPALLAEIRVRATASCVDTQDGQVILAIWDQARAALMASIIAEEDNPPLVSTMRYERRTDPRTGKTLQQQLTFATATGRRFQTVPSALTLSEEGYRRQEGQRESFYAPDASVLVDDDFIGTHCFDIQSGVDDHRGQVGLRFTPRSDRGSAGRVDVKGTLWLDSTLSRLLEISYGYTGLDGAWSSAGGSIEFETLESGVVFVESWKIVLPSVRYQRMPGSGSISADEARVIYLSETGGFVLTARWPDSTEWRGRIGGVGGRVAQKDSRQPVTGAEISLASGGSTWTDDHGSYSLSPLPPGLYDITLVDSTWSYFIPQRAQRREVRVGREAAVVDFEVPFHGSVLDQLCGASGRGPSVLLGMVSDGSADRPVDLQVSIASERTSTAVPVDPAGRFVECRPPSGSLLRLSLRYKGLTIADTAIESRALPAEARVVRWSIDRNVFSPARRGDRAVLSGRVFRSGLPLSGVQVRLMQSGDTATTKPDGSFRFVGLTAMTYSISFPGLGAGPVADTVTLSANREVSRSFIATPTRSATALPVASPTMAVQRARGRISAVGANTPIVGASVILLDSAARERERAVSDDSGRYSIAVHPDGRALRVTRIGFAPIEVRLPPILSDTTIDLQLTPIPVQLDTTRTSAATTVADPNIAEFARRQRTAPGGNFITASVLSAARNTPFTSLLRSEIPGLIFENYRGQTLLRTRRGPGLNSDVSANPSDPRAPRGCWANIYLDGMAIYSGPPTSPPDIGSFNGADLAAVEYYQGGATLPQQFRNMQNNCGTLLLWIRRRPGGGNAR